MNHKHRATLHSLFAHPISSNINDKMVHAVIEGLGGEITQSSHGHAVIKLNGQTHGFHATHATLSKDQVVELRKFLEAAGVDPARDYPL